MEKQGNEVHVDTDEARGGSTPNVVRWVLAISLLLAVVAMSAIWIIPAMMTDDTAADATVADQYEEEQDNSGIVPMDPEYGEDTAAETSADNAMAAEPATDGAMEAGQ